MYRQTSNIRLSLEENKLAYHSLYLWMSFPKITKKNTPLVPPLRARYMGVFLWVHIWPNFCVQYRVIFDCNMSRVYSEMMMMMIMMIMMIMIMTVIMNVILVIWKVRINHIIMDIHDWIIDVHNEVWISRFELSLWISITLSWVAIMDCHNWLYWYP